ncbi:MAG: acyltransferase [Clostridia bacterium]|nr:acyltransferase [Clostridia bacterium]
MKRSSLILPRKIESLQVLRFLGAMCITLYHFTGLQGDCPYDFSQAVYLFYMISGFVVMFSTRSPDKRKYFLTRRLIKTLPLYWGLTILTFIAGLAVPSFLGYTPTFPQLVKSLLFIPFRRTTAKAGSALRPIVGLGHTLQIEMLFYILFLISMRISHKYRGYIAAALAGVMAVIGIVFPTDNPVIHFYTVNRYSWFSFIIGIAIYGVFTFIESRELKIGSRAVSAIAAVIAAGSCVPVFISGLPVWYSLVMFGVILTAALLWSVSGMHSPRFLVRLGDTSFSYYLIHQYIVALAVRLFAVNGPSVANFAIAAAVSALSWGIARVSWYLIENKLVVFLQERIIKDG